MMTTAKLLLHCPDKPGILAEVTDFITVNKGNIIYLDQYVDHVENIFFMRIEWELKDFLVPQEKIEDYFRTLYGQKYEMDFRLYFSDVKPRMAIFVSKLSHCLFLCVVSMFLIYIGLQLFSAYVFGLALILLIASLGVSFREIQISTRSLEIYLGTMEKGKNKK